MISWRRLATGVLLVVAVLGAAAGAVESQAQQNSGTAPRAQAQAPAPRTLIKYIASGNVELQAAPQLNGFEIPSQGHWRGLAVDQSGNLYVGLRDNRFNTRVGVFAPDGRYLRDWNPYPFSGSSGPKIAIGPTGLVYVQNVSQGHDGIRVYTPDGTLVRSFGAEQISQAGISDLEVDAFGNVYAATGPCCGSADDHVVRFNPLDQVTGRLVPIPGRGNSSINAIRTLASLAAASMS